MPEFIIGAKRRGHKPPFYTPIIPGSSPLVHRLRAAYLFNENTGTTVNDATHGAQHASVVGAGGWNNNPPTLLGPTVNFDGNTYVSSPQGIYLGVGTTNAPGLTVSCRMTLSSLYTLATNNWLWALFAPGSSLRSYAYVTSTANLYFAFAGTLTSGQSVFKDTIYDVVCTMGGGAENLYLNGVLVQTKATVNPLVAGLYSLWIGSRNLKDASNNNWGGSIDAVYLWDRLLDASEVATLWKAPFAPIPTTNGLRKLYPGNATRTSAAATALTMAGPTVGGIGVVSPPFTVQTSPVFGTITGTCTVTPSDAGAGGTFTPTTVAVTTASPGATFTYTPIAGPSVTISITNNTALTNPASIIMAVPAYVPPVGTIPTTDANLTFSPYTWRAAGGSPPVIVTNNIGARLKFGVTGTYNLAITYDTAPQVAASAPATEYPIIGVIIDDAPMQVFQLAPGQTTQALAHFTTNTAHYIDLVHLKSSQAVDRWGTVSLDPANQLRLTNILVDSGGSSIAYHTIQPKRAIIFGTSITEGVQAAGNGTIQDNNALWAWSSVCADALQCEHGQIGFGGSSLQQTNANGVPGMFRCTSATYTSGTSHDSPIPLDQAWKNYDYQHTRLVAGKFLPMPDYLIIEHGTNDYGHIVNTNLYDPLNVNGAYGLWPAIRAALNATTPIIHLIPFTSANRAGIQSIAATYGATDPYFYLVDPGIDLSGGLGGGVAGVTLPNPAPSYLSYGNVHPSLYGAAKTGARIAAAIRVALAPVGSTAGQHSHSIPRGR